jgi:hypothetical protein
VDAKDQLFLRIRDGGGVDAAALDQALGGQFSSDPRDALLVAHWLAGEVAVASHENWWNGAVDGALLRAVGLASARYSSGWGGRPEYALTIWSFENVRALWPLVYERVLDEAVVPVLLNTPSPLDASAIVEAAREEARLRVVALTAESADVELCDAGTQPPLLALLGELYEDLGQRRVSHLLSQLDWYALLAAWRMWGEEASARVFASALVRARDLHRDPYLAICECVHAGRWYVEATETGVSTFVVSLREYEQRGSAQGGEFDTEEENLARAVAYTDSLRERCREHNHTLAWQRREILLARLRAFALALENPEHESASALAARKAAATLDASKAVNMLRARL